MVKELEHVSEPANRLPSLRVGTHANPAGLGVVGCGDVGDTDVKLLDVLAEILVAAAAKEPGNCLRRGKVGPKDDLRAGVAEHVSVEVGHALAGHDDCDA